MIDALFKQFDEHGPFKYIALHIAIAWYIHKRNN